MSMTDVLAAADIKKAVGAFSAPNSFNHQKFFHMSDMKSKNKEQIIKLFRYLDQDVSGYIEEQELVFDREARPLSHKETKDMLSAGDKHGHGKIDIDDFIAMVKES